MKNFTMKSSLAAAMMVGASGMCAMAQTSGDASGAAGGTPATIEGYYRIQAANRVDTKDGYVEMSGPVSAYPKATEDAARTSASTVMHVKGVPEVRADGKTVYRVESLSSQGIEVVGEVIDWEKVGEELINIPGLDLKNLNTNTAYALVNWARDKGYTASVRAVIQFVFSFLTDQVSDRFLTDADAAQVTQAQKQRMAEITKGFNNNVAANINLYTYVEPVEGATDTYKYYFTFPNVWCVADWYTGKDRQGNPVANGLSAEDKALFDIVLRGAANTFQQANMPTGEHFGQWEQEQMALPSWSALSVLDKYADCKNADGSYDIPYSKIFADGDLLFEWIKLWMVRISTGEGLENCKLGDMTALANKINSHQLTQKVFQFIKRVHADRRYYLMAGRLDNTDAATEPKSHTYTWEPNFSFANEAETAECGTDGKGAQWVIRRINLNQQAGTDFAIDLQSYRTSRVAGEDQHYFSTFYYDFPVKVPQGSDILFYVPNHDYQDLTLDNGFTLEYYRLHQVDADGVVPARTPVMVTSIHQGLNQLQIVQPEDQPSASAMPRIGARTATTADASQAPMDGIFLGSAVTPEQLQRTSAMDYSDAAKPIYRLTSTTHEIINDAHHTTSSLYFKRVVEGEQMAPNTAFLHFDQDKFGSDLTVPDSNLKYIYIDPNTTGDPGLDIKDVIPEDYMTGVENVAVDLSQEPSEADSVLYDLQGRRAGAQPAPGLYITASGRKLLVK